MLKSTCKPALTHKICPIDFLSIQVGIRVTRMYNIIKGIMKNMNYAYMWPKVIVSYTLKSVITEHYMYMYIVNT